MNFRTHDAQGSLSHPCVPGQGPMQTPSPVKERPLTVGDLSAAVNSSGPAASDSFNGETYDEEFLREIDGLALDASISEDVIPTIFYTPRVSGKTVTPTSPGRGLSSDSSLDGSRDVTAGSPVRQSVLGQFRGSLMHNTMSRHFNRDITCTQQVRANELRVPPSLQRHLRMHNPRQPARPQRPNRLKTTTKQRVKGKMPTPKTATDRGVRFHDRLHFLAPGYVTCHECRRKWPPILTSRAIS